MNNDDAESRDFCRKGFDGRPSDRPRTTGEIALNLAVSESLANHGHHALVNAHEAAASGHEHLAEAGVGDVEEHLDLARWHRWCAIVEDQLADEADRRTPARRDRRT
ncbi:hypothetical protein FHS43_000326 [Streptosporangium becharense]|uniref:Uncharacterized protein n=1 Tax=Streptosporangium becharense TaxID=1816182 RepID=A0A7W9IFR5_9ACTN|nr:hypothetical protein [Streptosporangium becharense]MBB2909080.1 hypothetical protein [Streptosporangium becharense]MBB5819902.1 hypothetical protein [Streptosporangium becharense]